jgi:hypothetical protein
MADDVSDAEVTVDCDVQAGGTRGLQSIVRQTYRRPMDGQFDPFAAFDMKIAKEMFLDLQRVYFAYEWKTFCDSGQGICAFSIPELMGPTLHMVIRLPELTPEKLFKLAGVLLERMNLPRTDADMANLLFAAQNRGAFDFSDGKKN